jgi:hypothetical protein
LPFSQYGKPQAAIHHPVLHDLLGHAPAEAVPLSWLMGRLGDRSFGIVFILLAILGLLPGVSALAVLMVPAFQMIMARLGSVLPRYIATQRIKTRLLVRMIGRVVPVLRYL